MGIDFKPENMLEKAIHEGNPEMLMQAIAEETVLTRLVSASCLNAECFTDEMIFSVIFLSIPKKLRETMSSGWFWGHLHAGERIKSLIKEALTPLPQDPSPEEKALIKAIVYKENEEVIRLIKNDGIKFQGFAPDLLLMLPGLSEEAALVFLKDGLSPKLKAIVLGILLKEAETPTLMKDFSYDVRVHYANLMLKIVSGKKFPADLQ